MLVRLVQKAKALSPMLVTVLPSMFAGIISSPDAFLSQPVIVTASPLIPYFKLGLTDTASGGLVPEAVSSGESLEGATLLFSPSHPMRRKAKRGIKYLIFVCDDAEVNRRETLQSERDFITKRTRLTSSCALAACFMSHRFTDPPKQHPRIRKGEGWIEPSVDL